MPQQSDVASHCVVQWEDSKEQYAIVDLKRSKAVSALKVGITTLFEGYNRERRRGKILFLGTKKDCFSYGFDIVEDDRQLNTYSWSGSLSLREQSEEIARAIHRSNSSSFQRTTSSSSTNSSTLVPKSKQKINNNKNLNNTDESTVSRDKSMPRPVTSSTVVSCEASDPVARCADHGQSSSSKHATALNSQSSYSISNAEVITTETDVVASANDINSLLHEIKSLRDKNFILQEELLYQREISIALPSEETYNYLKSICFMHEQIKNERNEKAIELGKKLPCTNIELKLAKKGSPSATINNLIKLCFKDVDLKDMSYEKLKAINSQLLEQIHDYVKHVHAPAVIPQSMFSGAISLRCRHLREVEKHKKRVPIGRKDIQKQNKKWKCSSNDHEREKENNAETLNEIVIEDMVEDKENFDCIK